MTDVGHHQPGDQIGLIHRRPLEGAAVVEHPHQVAFLDAAFGGVGGVDEHPLPALDLLLVRRVAVLAVEERVRFGRDDAQREAFGEFGIGL